MFLGASSEYIFHGNKFYLRIKSMDSKRCFLSRKLILSSFQCERDGLQRFNPTWLMYLYSGPAVGNKSFLPHISVTVKELQERVGNSCCWWWHERNQEEAKYGEHLLPLRNWSLWIFMLKMFRLWATLVDFGSNYRLRTRYLFVFY